QLYNGYFNLVELDNELIYDTDGSPDDYALFDADVLLRPETPAFLALADDVLAFMIAIIEFRSEVALGGEVFADSTLSDLGKFEFAEIVTLDDRLQALTDSSSDFNVLLIERADEVLSQLQLLILEFDTFKAYFNNRTTAKRVQNFDRDVGQAGIFLGAVIRLAGPSIGLPPEVTTGLALSFELPGSFKSAWDTYQMMQKYKRWTNSKAVFFGRVGDQIAGSVKALKLTARNSAFLGFVLAAGVTIGIAVYTIVKADLKPGTVEFNTVITEASIALTVELVFLVIGFIIPVGTILILIVSLFDIVASAVCEIYKAVEGQNSISDPVESWVCNGLTGAITEALTYAIHDTWLTVNTNKEDRLDIQFEDPELLTEDGFKAGAEVELSFTVVSTITLNEPDEGVIKNSRATLDLGKIMRGSTFIYELQDEELDLHKDLGFDGTSWTAIGQKKAVETFNPTYEYTFDEVGQNLTPGDLYLTESYNIVNYECWGFIGTSEETCKRHAVRGSSHIPVGSLYFDIFPADINDFIVTRGGEVISWIVGAGIIQPYQDVDGDGLLPDNGADPDNFSPDSDSDGLSDAWELENGTDATQADRDNDGLSDYWEIFYNTNPHRSDTDGDGLLDGEEFFHSQTNYAWEEESEPWTGGWTIIYDVDDEGNGLETFVSANPTISDTDSDGIFDVDEAFYNYNPTVQSKLNPLAIDGMIKTNSEQAGIVGLDDTVTFTATVENKDTFLSSLTANLDVEIPTGSLQSTQAIGQLDYGQRATVSDEAGIGQVGATTFSSVTLRAEGFFLDDSGNAPVNISKTPLVNLPFNEPLNSGTFVNLGLLGGNAFCDLSAGDSNLEGCPYTGVEGKNGNGIMLYAGNDRITYTNASLASQSFSVGFWFNSLTHSRATDAFQWGEQKLELIGFGDNGVSYKFAEKSGDSCVADPDNQLYAFGGIFDERWSHVMFTHDYDDASSTSTISLYVDGKLIDEAIDTTEGACLTDMDNLGLYGGFSAGSVASRIDDLLLFGEALSATDIDTLYTYQLAQFDTEKQYPLTIDATGPDTSLAVNSDISNDITLLAVSAVDDLSTVRGVTVTVTSPDNLSEVIVPVQQETNSALWYFYFEPTIEGEYSFSFEAVDAVYNVSTNSDSVYVDGSPPVADLDSSLESEVLTTAPLDLRDPNELYLAGTAVDNRTMGEQLELDLLDWQSTSAFQSEVIPVTVDGQNDSLGSWTTKYQVPDI
ncbi:MAG: LamG-like jellyroll fold domain-containing protein, partial [Chloroflexota bacterium]